MGTHKRVWRLYERAGAQTAWSGVCSTDFTMDALSNGQRVQYLTVAEDLTKEAIDVSDNSIPGQYVTRLLDQWAYHNGVQLQLIFPGKPTENYYVETFNWSLSNECLNLHWFERSDGARARL